VPGLSGKKGESLAWNYRKAPEIKIEAIRGKLAHVEKAEKPEVFKERGSLKGGPQL